MGFSGPAKRPNCVQQTLPSWTGRGYAGPLFFRVHGPSRTAPAGTRWQPRSWPRLFRRSHAGRRLGQLALLDVQRSHALTTARQKVRDLVDDRHEVSFSRQEWTRRLAAGPAFDDVMRAEPRRVHDGELNARRRPLPGEQRPRGRSARTECDVAGHFRRLCHLACLQHLPVDCPA